MTVYNDILEWSKNIPLWQQDALRRIIVNGNLTDEDYHELETLCRYNSGAETPNEPPELKPLAEHHLDISDSSNDTIALSSLRHIEGVNALARDQLLSFGNSGLTVIYGPNGSGKSGYARILRELCQARYSGERILPNVFSAKEGTTPTAEISYKMSEQEKTFYWQEGYEVPDELKQINFFDAACASVHLNKSNELAFTPTGLDVIPKLYEACNKISKRIEQDQEQLRVQTPSVIKKMQLDRNTSVVKLLKELNGGAKKEDFQRLAKLSADEQKRISEIERLLADDPKTRIGQSKKILEQLDKLLECVKAIREHLSREALKKIKEQCDSYWKKKEAAGIAAQQAFQNTPLTGVGEHVWRELWEAARQYSTQVAYPEEKFPFTGSEARCLLCQQPIKDEEVSNRLHRFEDFVRGEIQQKADEARRVIEEHLKNLQEISIENAPISANKVAFSDSEKTEIVDNYFHIALKIRNQVFTNWEHSLWKQPLELPEEPIPYIEQGREEIQNQIQQLERADDEEQRKKLNEELAELKDRQWLQENLESIEEEIDRRWNIDFLEKAKKDTQTNAITRKSSELTEKYVTEELQKTFDNELKEMGGREQIPARLHAPRGKQGRREFELTLDGAAKSSSLIKVVSEGEARCVALAGFLAELITEESYSSIIFDDPVRSLDNNWKRKIAERIASYATERQTIIFTHDISFLKDLERATSDRGVEAELRTITRNNSTVGCCQEEAPWKVMSVKRRIGHLNHQAQQAEVAFRKKGRSAYEYRAIYSYGLLREAWEQAVEEVLFANVVQRFQENISTSLLRYVKVINENDIDAVDKAMRKTSRFLPGHDDPDERSDTIPDPDELQEDIQKLDNWVKDIRRRWKN